MTITRPAVTAVRVYVRRCPTEKFRGAFTSKNRDAVPCEAESSDCESLDTGVEEVVRGVKRAKSNGSA